MIKKIKKILRKLAKKLVFSKREKFALIVGILTLGLFLVQLVNPNWRYPFIGGLVILTFFLSIWGLKEDLAGIEWLTLFILPAMYAGAISLFYFLLPVRWLTRLPTAILFAVGMYAILLVENIYNVAAIRTIQLLRAAHSVGLLLTLFTVFLLYSIIFSLHAAFYWNLPLVFLVSLPLALQSLWVMKLEPTISGEILFYSIVVSLGLGEMAFIFSFWPIQGVLEALFLTTGFYTLVGIVQQHLIERLFEKTLIEFMAVSGIVFILILFTTSWGG